MLPSANLAEVDMSDANLSDANLSDANLSDATLPRADLSGADLRRINLSRSNLSSAILNNSNLTRSDMRGSILSQADVSEVDLSYADMRRSSLLGAGLTGADVDFTDLTGAALGGASGCLITGTPVALPVGYSIVGGCLTFTPSDDVTRPIVTCVRAAPVFRLNKSPAVVKATLRDETAPGSARVTALAPTSSVGSRKVRVSGQDAAGNVGSTRCRYRVVYRVSNFRPPVNNGRVVNVSKAGRSVAFRFSVVDANRVPVRDISGLRSKTAVQRCKASAPSDRIERYTKQRSGLKNMGNGKYSWVLKTQRRWAGTCRTVSLTLNDGVRHSAKFRFTR
jgi:hypothetical protein